jgi:peptidoglycan hydrolase-like protein with peptidoglycan-binding domain/TPR repeat protein
MLLAAGMLAMAAEPARALAASVKDARPATPAHPADPVAVLARGSGYGGGTDAALVRSLQRRLDSSGFTPGPIDGIFGPRTEHAVELFQSAHGLVVDGIAGPATLSALRTPSTVLFPGAGYPGAGSGAVRRLQRELRRDGFSPGPIDGRYGPVTERAVRRFQAAHALQVDGIAGRQTFGELKRVAAGRGTAPRSRPRPRPTTPTRPTTPSHPRRPSHPRTPSQPATPSSHRGRTSRSGGASWPVALVVAGLICLLALISGVWLIDRRRRRTSNAAVVQPAGSDKAPAVSSGLAASTEAHGPVEAAELVDAEDQDDAVAASNLGVLLERRGDLAGAEASYRQADARGSADGAFNLAGLLLERGDVEAAMAAYHRADERGDAMAAATLGLLLLEQGDEVAALDAYARADERGDVGSAVNLGVLCERRGDLVGAEAAYRRADARGSADGAFNLGALLEERGDLTDAIAAYHRADERGDTTAALHAGLLLERRGHLRDALAAFQRAQRSDQPRIAEVARSREEALALGISLAGKRGER